MQWLLYELLWRDFFRFVTQKSTQAARNANAQPQQQPQLAYA